MRDYVAPGALRLESHPVAFLDGDSLRAATAALCAQEQHKCVPPSPNEKLLPTRFCFLMYSTF